MRLRPRAVAANNKKELTESQSALSLRGRQLGCSDVVASSEFKATIELAVSLTLPSIAVTACIGWKVQASPD